MFTYKHYVPVLKAKQGELTALFGLTDAQKNIFTPLLELVSEKTEIKQIEKTSTQIKKALNDKIFFVDVYFPKSEYKTKELAKILHKFLQLSIKDDLQCIPVIGLERDAEFVQTVKDYIDSQGAEICIRLFVSDLKKKNLSDLITALLKQLKRTSKQSHFIFDLAEIDNSHVDTLSLMLQTVIPTLPLLNEWNTFTLCSSAFPQTMGSVKSGSNNIERGEWILWSELLGQKSTIGRMPTFGDYAINYPQLSDGYDPITMDTSANIRYTSDDYWLILKGKGLKKAGYDQFFSLSKLLTKLPEYMGESFSTGDKYIKDCSDRKANKGNTTTWRFVGTNHHLVFVGNQIASLP